MKFHPLRRLASRWKSLGPKRKRWIAGFIFLSHLVGALTSVQAVMSVRTSQGAIAWVVSLNTFPYVAVPAYWVFGRSEFNGHMPQMRTDQDLVRGGNKAYVDKLVERDQLAFPGRSVATLGEKLAKLPMTQGNSVDLLMDGEAIFDSIFDGIDRAKDYILFQFYIIKDDELGRKMRDRLIARAKAGVRCYVLYDEIGSSSLPKRYLKELWAGGVQAVPFNSTKGAANRFQINFRNHRKLLVVDGKEAWVGGVNVADEYLGRDPGMSPWRDTQLRLQGPVVSCIQVSFTEDWHWASGNSLNLNWEAPAAAQGQGLRVLCLPSGPADPSETCTLYFVDLINRAKKRLWIASPYFVPDEQFITALKLAALRGVEVKILIPDKTDSRMVQFTGWSYLEELEQAGIQMWRHLPGFMHQKVVLMDDTSVIGTANFDNRSFRLNFEITMAIESPEFTKQVEAMLTADFAQARLPKAQELTDRGFWFRFATRACRLMAPVQ
ncbi:MAG: cardiolipin synthase [Verrucomicrobiota bacterium]